MNVLFIGIFDINFSLYLLHYIHTMSSIVLGLYEFPILAHSCVKYANMT